VILYFTGYQKYKKGCELYQTTTFCIYLSHHSVKDISLTKSKEYIYLTRKETICAEHFIQFVRMKNLDPLRHALSR